MAWLCPAILRSHWESVLMEVRSTSASVASKAPAGPVAAHEGKVAPVSDSMLPMP